jgi:hypothetical protein
MANNAVRDTRATWICNQLQQIDILDDKRIRISAGAAISAGDLRRGRPNPPILIPQESETTFELQRARSRGSNDTSGMQRGARQSHHLPDRLIHAAWKEPLVLVDYRRALIIASAMKFRNKQALVGGKSCA